MLRTEVITTLKAHERELRALGVEGLYLFGSVARGEAKPGSDVDLFFDHAPGLGLGVVTIHERMREILAVDADVTTRRSLHPLLRQRIEKAAVQVF